MEKDFKKEYSKHIKSETPDLWARIESGLTEKTPVSKPCRWGKWMAAVPAAAAVVLLVVAAPIFMPKGSFSSMEKAAMDLALFDGKADSAAPEAGFYEEEAVAEESIPEHLLVKEEADAETETGGGSDGNPSGGATADGNNYSSSKDKAGSGNTSSGGAADSNPDETYTYAERQETQTTTDEKDGITEEQKAEREMTEEKVLHLQVVEQIPTDNTNLLAEDKEHITQTYDLYLVLVDGEEKLLAVPMEIEIELEAQIWYDVTVTEAEESGIDYIWVK